MNTNHGNPSSLAARRYFAAIRVFAIVLGAGLLASAVGAQVYSVLHDFESDPSPGNFPLGPLIQVDGSFYGESALHGGGANPNRGAIFRLNGKNNSFQILQDFAGPQFLGAGSSSSLIESSGYILGSCFSTSCPFRFRMDFIGNLDGACLEGVLPTFAAMTPAFGNLYFVLDDGALSRMDSVGNVTVLHNLGDDNMIYPSSELLLASDGNLYGLTMGDRDTDVSGTLYRSDADGNVTVMHVFSESDPDEGFFPLGRLVEQGGFLWGTTQNGGTSDAGVMFRMDFAGNFATLHSFAFSDDGDTPTGLVVASPSSFYGTTFSGGQFDGGTLYEIDTFGNTTVLHSFGDVGDGSEPGPLLKVSDGGTAYYGTTFRGGAHDAGTIYVYTPATTKVILSVIPTAGPIRVLPGDPVQIHGGVFPVGEVPTVRIGGLEATNVQVLDQEHITAATPPDLSPGTLNDIIIVMPDGSQASREKAWMADFLDVPGADRLHPFVERVFRAGLMNGCGGGNFCEGDPVDRSAMVVMALRAKHGPAWAPPECTGTFKDVPCPGPEADWIEDAVTEGIAQPCARNKFCPGTDLTRETLPDLLLKTEHGADYAPPSCTGIFKDVKCPGPHANAIEQVYREGVVEACSTSPLSYCPKRRASRGPVAEYEARAYRLP